MLLIFFWILFLSSSLSLYIHLVYLSNFWVETFDPLVREKNKLNWTISDIHKALEISNKYWAYLSDDWLYHLLPWINILYGLPFTSEDTLKYNLDNLSIVLKKWLKTRRTFIRRITSPYWFNYWLVWKYKTNEEKFKIFEKEINDKFIMPMQEIVYQIWSVIYWLEEIVYDWVDTMIRKIWTCPERFIIRWTKLDIWKKYNIKIIKHVSPRVMEWVII